MNDLSNISIEKVDYKRERKYNAVKLPCELKQEQIPKYVSYYKECYNVQKKLYREFFKIEKHPKMIKNKVYISSKSNKINILEKLEEIKKILKKLNESGENEENNKNKHEKNELNDEENNHEKNELNNEENNEENNKTILPKYISLKPHEKDSNKYYLIYDKKTNEYRNTYKCICNKSIDLKINLQKFIEKLDEKFISETKAEIM
tara:strand:- start:779 stop:1393 length:615 start_codon:yes stop_codon:yes gene_type:complete